MTFSTIDDVTNAVAELFGVKPTKELRNAVFDAIPGKYEAVELTDAFLRDVWERAFPDAQYPF